MTTITYGSDDAIYNSGVYGEAVYGEFGPTLLIDSVSASASLGTVQVSVNVETTLNGFELVALEGAVEASGGALESLTGLEGTSSLGNVSIRATAGLVGQQLNVSLGSIKPNVIEHLPSLSATGFVGTTQERGVANKTLPSLSASIQLGDTTETAVVFNFEAIKEKYDRKRTVIIVDKKITSDERQANVV